MRDSFARRPDGGVRAASAFGQPASGSPLESFGGA